MSLLIIIFSLALNILYYVVSQKLKIKIFTKYFIGFTIYSSILFILIISFDLKLVLNNFIPFFAIYMLFFISLFLSISMKYIKSPTYLIFKSLKKVRKKNEIIKYLERRKIIQIRIRDLESQNILKVKNKKMSLKKNLGLVINIFFFMKKFLNLKSEG
tara:strand:+ start:82 stop:555 length:474 start_codon:yes stop_codon:yes gene_type:complete